MLKPTIILLLLLLVTSLLATAEHIEVHLRSGSTVQGRLINQDDAALLVETVVATRKGAMTAQVSYKRSDIASITVLPDPEEEYGRRAKTATDANGHVALARWCRDHGLIGRYREEAILAIGCAPDHAEAKALLDDLGLMLADGRWRPEAEVLAAQGKVRYKGQILSKTEAAERKAAEDRQQDTQEAIGDGAAGVATCDRQLASIDRRRGQIVEDIATATAAATAARDLTRKATEAKTAFEAAETTLQQAKVQQAKIIPGDAAAVTAAATATAELQRKTEEAQKAANTAKRAAAGSERAVTTHQARVAALKDEDGRLQRQRETVVSKRAVCVKAVEEAKAELARQAQPAPAPAAVTPDAAR